MSEKKSKQHRKRSRVLLDELIAACDSRGLDDKHAALMNFIHKKASDLKEALK